MMEMKSAKLPVRNKKTGKPSTSNIRVAAYGRISDISCSADMLKNHYIAVIQEHDGWSPMGIYLDEYPAMLSCKRRPAFQKLLLECQKGEVDLVLVRSASYLARNVADCLRCVRTLLERGVELYFERENISTMSPEFDMVTVCMTKFAEAEAKHLKNQPFGWPAGKRVPSGRRGRT